MCPHTRTALPLHPQSSAAAYCRRCTAAMSCRHALCIPAFHRSRAGRGPAHLAGGELHRLAALQHASADLGALRFGCRGCGSEQLGADRGHKGMIPLPSTCRNLPRRTAAVRVLYVLPAAAHAWHPSQVATSASGRQGFSQLRMFPLRHRPKTHLGVQHDRAHDLGVLHGLAQVVEGLLQSQTQGEGGWQAWVARPREAGRV